MQVVRTSVIPGKDGSAIVVVLRNRGDAPVSDLPDRGRAAWGRPTQRRAECPVLPVARSGHRGRRRDDLGLRDQGEDRVGPGLRADRGAAGVGPRGRRRAGARRERCGLARSARAGAASWPRCPTAPGSLSTTSTSTPSPAGAGGTWRRAAASLTHLGVDQKAELTLNLIGDAKGSQIQIYAPPTLFE